MTGYDFVIVINEESWYRFRGTNPKACRALIDHELCHCGINDEGNWTIWEHDVQEFASVISRHGLWNKDNRQFGEVVASKMKQLRLDVDKDNKLRVVGGD